jgi:hypothetical protein
MRTIVLSTVVVGAAAVGASFGVGGDDPNWVPSTLTNLGVAVLLFAPIYWATRALDNRIEGVRVETAEKVRTVEDMVEVVRSENTSAIQSLSAQLTEARGQQNRNARHALSQVAQAPSREAFQALHTMAISHGWLSQVVDARVFVDDTDIFVSVPAVYRYSEMSWSVGSLGRGEPSKVLWPASKDGLAFFSEVESKLRELLPAGSVVDVERLLNGYVRLIDRAISDDQVREMVTAVWPNWIICVDRIHGPTISMPAERWRASDDWLAELHTLSASERSGLDRAVRVARLVTTG